METLENKYIKRDSFDEVDRILIIVEKTKEKYERSTQFLSYLIWAYTISLFIFVAAFSYSGGISASQKSEKFLAVIIASILLLAFGISQIRTFLVRKTLNQKEFTTITLQATEVIREIVPALARSERWSVLQKFELRLRLSRLGIGTEKIFGPEM